MGTITQINVLDDLLRLLQIHSFRPTLFARYFLKNILFKDFLSGALPKRTSLDEKDDSTDRYKKSLKT